LKKPQKNNDDSTKGERVSSAWTAVLGAFFLTTSFGIIYSYGDFFLPLERQFGWTHAIDSTVPALALLVFSLGAILGGYLADRVGFRRMCYLGTLLIGLGTILASQIQNLPQLLILFGFVTPLGTSFVVIIATALPVRWFLKRRGLAVGVMAAGSGFGTLIVPPLIAVLIQPAGWRAGFFALGVGFFVVLALASYFTQSPEERKLKPYGWEERTRRSSRDEKEERIFVADEDEELDQKTPRQALKTRAFWMIYVMFFLGSFGATMFLVHAVPFASSIGISSIQASIALGVFGAGSLLSRVVIGVIADRLNRAFGIILSFLIQFVSLGMLEFVGVLLLRDFSLLLLLFYLCSFGVGFGYGGYLSDFIALTGDLFGRKWIQKIWAFNETAFGFAGLVSPIAAGLFFDLFQSYSLIFEIASLAALVGLIMAIFLASFLRKEGKGENTS
jgi:OFA family oxalate/formate antiporter-like MFS transporter